MQKVKDAPKTGATTANAKAAAPAEEARDWSKTLFLPKTDFAMKAGLPNLEPKLLERWEKIKLFKQVRKAAKNREKFILHDGPPYANGNIHIGHALNKILKDMVARSQLVMGRDSNYVPGWDCHGLPIEWKSGRSSSAARARAKRRCADQRNFAANAAAGRRCAGMA